VVTCEIKLFRNNFSLRRRVSEITLEVASNYFKIISQACCSTRIFFNTFTVVEMILK